MAEKRMFSKKIIDTDWFMDMPASSQNLYFHLSMRADDDGFVSSPKRIIKLIGATEDDYKILISKRFIIPFESGVCVITDWRINNYLRNDRYTETVYKQEKDSLVLNENGKYEFGIPTVYPELSNTNSNTNSLIDNKYKEIKKESHKYGEYNHVLLTDAQYEKLIKDFGEKNTKLLIKKLDEAIEIKGYKYKNHNLVLRGWVLTETKKSALWENKKPEREYVVDTSEQDKQTDEMLKDDKSKREFEEFMKSRKTEGVFKSL